MRTWGREIDKATGKPVWVAVATSPTGDDTQVWLTTLIQTLKLNLGESPFYAQFGIPGQPSIAQQIFPDYYVSLVQQQFAPYFASLSISRVPQTKNPTYQINILSYAGATYRQQVAV